MHSLLLYSLSLYALDWLIDQTSDWIFVNGKSMEASPTLSTPTATLKSSYASASLSIESIVSSDPSYLLFVSDLRVGGEATSGDTASGLSRQLLVDFVSGRLGGASERALASKVARVVIAGNSVAPFAPASTRDRFSATKAHQPDLGGPAGQLDTLLAQLLGTCPVDVMPGKSDPTNVSLPQQPLHPCLFKHSSRFDSLNLVPNPYEFAVDDCTVIGHSGQPTDDILRQTRTRVADSSAGDVTAHGDDKMAVDAVVDGAEGRVAGDADEGVDALAALRKTLVWGHICPTAPDTLACHPFTEDDPFIVAPAKTPRILFTGCQKSFSTCMEKGTRLLCVPSFHATQQVVLVDTRSLNYQVLEFKVSSN